MCIGLPMQVMTAGLSHAVCRTRDGTLREIDTGLVGPVSEGDWLLTFLDTARDVVSAETAAQIGDALDAVGLAMAGRAVDPAAIDALFPDLAHRTPELPPHLQAQLDGAAPRTGAEQTGTEKDSTQ